MTLEGGCLPVDDANCECNVDKIASSFPGAGGVTFGEVLVRVIVIVAVCCDVCALKVCCSCEPGGKESPDNEPPEHIEAFKDEDRDPVEESGMAVDRDEIVDQGYARIDSLV